MKMLIVGILAALALAACTHRHRMFGSGAPPFNPEHPRVYVIPVAPNQVYVVVDQEPIVFGNRGKVKVKWHVQDSKYRFATAGIQFQQGLKSAVSGCAADATDDSFACDNDTSVSGTFKYTIRVEPKQPSDPTPPPVDPTIVNR